MALNIQLKPESLTREIGFGGKAVALGSRTTADLAKFLLLAYSAGRADYVALFNNPPTKQQLLDDGVTLDGVATQQPPPPPVTALTGNVWNISTSPKQTLSIPPEVQARTIYVVSDSGSDGALFVSASGQNLTLTEGAFSQTLKTNATTETLIRYTNFSGVREAWIDNPEGMAIPNSLEIGDTLTVNGGLTMGNNAQIQTFGENGHINLNEGGNINLSGGDVNLDGGSINLSGGNIALGGGLALTPDQDVGGLRVPMLILQDSSDGNRYLLRITDGQLEVIQIGG